MRSKVTTSMERTVAPNGGDALLRRQRWDEERRCYYSSREHAYRRTALLRRPPRPLQLPRPLAPTVAHAQLPSSYFRGQLLNSVFVCLALFQGTLDMRCDVPGAQCLGSLIDARPWLPLALAPRRSAQRVTLAPLPNVEAASPLYEAVAPPALQVFEDRRKRRRRKYSARTVVPARPPPGAVRCVPSGVDWELHWTALGDKRVRYFFANGSDSTSAADCKLQCQSAATVVREFAALYQLLDAKIHRWSSTPADAEVWEVGAAAFSRQEDCAAFRARLQLAINVLRGEFNYDRAVNVRAQRYFAAAQPEPKRSEPSGPNLAVVTEAGVEYLDFDVPRLRPEVDLTELLLRQTAPARAAELYIPPAWLLQCMQPPAADANKRQKGSPRRCHFDSNNRRN